MASSLRNWIDTLFFGLRVLVNHLNEELPERNTLKVIGGTFTDDATGERTVLTIAGGTPLASVVGSTWIGVNSTDPQNPIVSISPAPTEAATADRIPVRSSAGDLFAATIRTTSGMVVSTAGTFAITQDESTTDGGDATISAQDGRQSGGATAGGQLNLSGGAPNGAGVPGGVSLAVAGVPTLRVGREATLADAPSVYLGAAGENFGLVIPALVEIVEITRLPRPSAGNAYNTAISGQSASSAGDGGDFTISGGDKAGGGTVDGSVVLVSGGKEGLRCTSGLATVGDPTNSTTVSCKIVGPVGTTVGAAGGASALPATPAGYLRILIESTERLIPFYPVP